MNLPKKVRACRNLFKSSGRAETVLPSTNRRMTTLSNIPGKVYDLLCVSQQRTLNVRTLDREMVVYVIFLRSKLIAGPSVVAGWLARAQQADQVLPFPPASCRSLRRFSPIGQTYRVTRSTMLRWTPQPWAGSGSSFSGHPTSTTGGRRFDSSFFGKPCINRGISGETSFQMILRFQQDVVSLTPAAVVSLGGRTASPETEDL